MKTPFQRIAAINLAIMLGLAVVLRLLNRGHESELSFLLMMAIALGGTTDCPIVVGFGEQKLPNTPVPTG